MKASSCGSARLTETVIALAIGMIATSAHAETTIAKVVLSDMAAVAGGAGGLVAALVHFSAIALVPPVEGRSRNTAQAAVEGVFSVVVGSIVGHYLAVPVAGIMPWVPLTSGPPVAFGLGVFAWQAAPGVIGGVKLATSPKRVARAVLGRLTTWAKSSDDQGDPS